MYQLYARDAFTRPDGAGLGDSEQGRAAIRGFAARFFGWYRGVKVRLVRPFGVGKLEKGGSPVMGAELGITTTSAIGGPCTVKAATFLQTKNGLITGERVYYKAASLEACGWSA